MTFEERDDLRERMKQFAISVAREVSIRKGDFGPDQVHEHRWAREGLVEPFLLDSVRATLKV